MTDPRSLRIQDVFDRACDLPEAAATAFVHDQFAAEPDLRAEVLALLAIDRARASLDALAADDPSPAEALVGTMAGPFRLVSVLGQGGMGVVYLAHQDSPSRDVAFKIIRSPFESASDRRRFEQEMQFLATLQHPGIASFIQTVTWTDGRRTHTGYAMELVRGRPLLQYAKERGLTIRQRLELFVKVAQAVQHAHTYQIIHRDLKPNNILVTAEGQPKVVDFGIARSAAAADHSLSGQVLGSLEFMPPEQATGRHRQTTPATDVYALGLILYNLLTDHAPYELRDLPAADALRLVSTSEPQRIGAIRRDLRGDIETIVGKAMERDPSRRYPAAGELAEDLTRFLRREPIRARPPTTWYVLSRAAARHKALAAGSVATLLALVLGLTLALIARSQALEYASALERRRWDIFDTPERLLGSIDAPRLQEILDDHAAHHDAEQVIDEIVIKPMLGDPKWSDPEQAEANAALANGAANFYRDAKWFDRAEPLFSKIVQIRIAQFGPDHPDVAAARANLAYMYLRMSRPADAEPLCVQAVPVLRRQRDPIWRPDFAGALDSLARAQLDLGRAADAERNYAEAVQVRRTLHGAGSELFGRALLNLGRCIDEQGRHAEALPLLQRAQAILETTLDKDDLFIALARASTAAALIPLGQVDQAKSLLVPLEAILDRPMVPDRLLDRIYSGMVALYAALGRTDPIAAEQAARWQARFDAWKQARG